MSLSYELAKELKDAGFPQTTDKVLVWPDLTNPVRVACPTLSELIEACGEDIMLTNECGHWEAMKESLHPLVRIGEAGGRYESKGQTPEEAVAMLYLALHGKGKTRASVEGK